MGGTAAVDEVVPDGPWRFDGDVAVVFDDMLRRSIPDFAAMREITTRLAARALRATLDPRLLDLGCSRGSGIAPILEHVPATRVVGIECAREMHRAATERFVDHANVDIIDADLRRGIPIDVPQTVIVACLTLQFVPIEYRRRLLHQARRLMQPDGCLIVVEKVLGESERGDETLVDEYLSMKARHGYTDEQIARKRLALEGVLVPSTASENERRSREAGFVVEPVWRAWNFAAWVAWPT